MLDFMRKYAATIIWIVILAFVLSLGILSFTRPQRGSGSSNNSRQTAANPNDLAYVNGKAINQQRFLRLYQTGLMNYRDPRQRDMNDPKVDAYVGYVALMQSIDMEKKLDYAKRLKVKVSKAEIDQQLNTIMNTYQITNKADFEKLLANNGLQPKAFREEIKQTLTIAKLEDFIKRTVSASEQDVKNQYKRVHARHILIAFQRPGLESRTEKEKIKLAGDVAANVYDQLMSGGDFIALAREYSDDTGSAVNGGDLGFFGVDMMVPEFEQMSFSLEPGQISKPFQTQYGYHIVRVEAVDQQEIPLDVDEKELQQQLLAKKQNAAVQQLNRRLQQEYTVEIVYPSLLAYDYKMNGDLDKSLNLYRSFGSQNPQDPLPFIFTAEIYELQGDNQTALAEYEKALLIQKLNPSIRIPYVHFYLANLYAKQKQNTKAISELQLAEAKVSDNLNILERIKDKYTELNAQTNANKTALKIEALEKALSVDQNASANEDIKFED